jgi:hypothetical protein
MKKRFAILSVFTMLAIASCGHNDETSTPKPSESSSNIIPSGQHISVLNNKSHIFLQSVNFDNALFITTYKSNEFDDVPYLNASDLKNFIKDMNDVNVDVKKEANAVTLTKQGNADSYVKFDANKNEISFKNPSLLADSSDNKIGHDYCLSTGGVIRSSKETKVGTVGKDEGSISLNDYSIKLYYENNQVYVPYDLFNVLIQPSPLVPFVFNGKDFFREPSSYKYSDIVSLCYSGNGSFQYGGTLNGYKFDSKFKKVTAKEGQKYTYESVDADGQPLKSNNTYFALFNNGKGGIYDSKTNTELVDADNKVTKIKYVEDKDYLTMYLSTSDQANPVEPSEESFDNKLVINLGETRYAKQVRSQTVADFTYNLLCLSFDKVYSVKEAKNIISFDKFFSDNNYKENLKSTNISLYEEAMVKLLNTSIDDGHTSIVALSAFDYQSDSRIVELNDKYKTEHSANIIRKLDGYYSQRYASFNFNENIKIEGDTAYLAFDKFSADYGFPASFRNYTANSDIEDLRLKDTCGYMAVCMLKIQAYNNDQSNNIKIKNIVVDITANMGGDMTVLPYVACIMTKDPKLCVGDSRTGQVVEYHYEADFDGDGVYGDTFADKFNFYLLTSDASFSCGSSLPSMVKGTNVKIIGTKGAGGASPITTFTDGSGLVYKTSGEYGIFYKDGNTYKTIENGVPVDYEIDKSLWYDYTNLTKKIDELSAK